jgi:capsular exopolysaccharide synthesis family protein
VKPVNILNLVQAFRRRWVLALTVGLCLGLLSAGLVYLLLPTAKYAPYTAHAQLYVKNTPPALLKAPEGSDDFNVDSGTVIARMKSREILEPVLEKKINEGEGKISTLSMLANQPDKVDFLRNEFQIEAAGSPEVISITLKGDRPKELALLVNALAEETVRIENARIRDLKAEYTKTLQEIASGYEKDLGPARELLKKAAEKAGSSESHVRNLNQILAKMTLSTKQSEKIRIESQLATIRARQAELRRLRELAEESPGAKPVMEKPAPSLADVREAAKSDQELQMIFQDIAEVEAEIYRITSLYQGNAKAAEPTIVKKGLRDQLATHQARALKVYQQKNPSSPDSSHSHIDSNNPEVLSYEIIALEKVKDSLDRDIGKLKEEAQDIQTSSQEFDNIQRQIALPDEMDNKVRGILENMRAEKHAPDRLNVQEQAEIPVVRHDRRSTFAGFTGLGACALGILGVTFMELRRRHVYSIADVAQGLEVPVVGTQPLLSPSINPVDPGHPSASDRGLWHTLPNDGVDATRALLLHSMPGTSGKTILVTSAEGGEGVSSLAIALAASLARAGKRTLLIDTNLRKPVVGTVLELPADRGLSEVLRGEMTVASVIRPAAADRLWVLPAGKPDLKAIQALSRDGAQTVLDQLRRDYDFVVLDAAPVLPCSDSLTLATRADVVLLSVVGGVSTLPAVHSGWNRLQLLGAHLFGVVLHDAADDATAAGWYGHTPQN